MASSWYGFDFGETVMNPLTLHQSALIRGIYSRLGRVGEAEEHVRKWYDLRDSFGAKYEDPELRVRDVKQYARARIYSEVLDGDSAAVKLYEEGEAEGFEPTPGLRQALSRLKSLGAAVSIVSESNSREAVMAIARFLASHGLTRQFDEVITPAGRFDPGGKMVGGEFLGRGKRDGAIYDQLVMHLRGRGVAPQDAAMVGDDPVLDVANSKKRGFLAIQYTGVVDRGASPDADCVIRGWDELPGLK